MERYKLMGTGKAQFNPMPDWSVYAILQIWSDERHALDFFNDNDLFESYRVNAKEYWVLFLKNKIARGQWNGVNPFKKSRDIDASNPYIVALTRATIKTSKLLTFWKFVPKSQTDLWKNEGLLFTKGIGEAPFKQMATFSVWKSEEYLNTFAYQTKGHVQAIGKTRKIDWYKEELFSRFQPYRSLGSWSDCKQWITSFTSDLA